MTTIIANAYTFLLNNGRLVERRVFEHLFMGAPREGAMQALLAYRNADGGFGNALEPDKRTAASQPIDQEAGLHTLDDLGWEAAAAERTCDFLQSITTPAGGVPFVLPTVRDAPRAPWWNCEDNPPASINPTASIAGLLHKHHTRHPWLEGADAFCWAQIEQLQAPEVHELLCMMVFLEHTPEQERAASAFQRLGKLALENTALDPQATGYVKMPLEWAPTPDSLCHGLYEASVLEAHLGALTARQQADGGWPITWPAISPACEMEYRGVVTLRALKTLRAYGRI